MTVGEELTIGSPVKPVQMLSQVNDPHGSADQANTWPVLRPT